ncbi:MAG TPA: YgeY family selenium metabolism-linked hydrolase [Candidatus Korarchaeota archaeon]|nr:YgeY family selenium metabolism-linked hydrolase [Candidatus Korarchaeota archaeon]
MASQVVSFLRELVRVKSLSGDEGELASLIKEELDRIGVDRVWTDEVGNVIAEIRGGGDGLLLFDAHMDTVPEGDLRNWRRDPFSADVVEGRVYGRGSVDMKGGLAAMVYSASMVGEEDVDLVYAFVVHEEDQEGFGVRHVIDALDERPDLVVLGEPTSLNLAKGHRGRAEVLVTLRGKTAHSSMPELGENCLHKICVYLSKLRDLEMNSHPLLGEGSVAPVNVEVSPGMVPIIPDRCSVLLDRRTVPGETKEYVEAQLEGSVVKRRLKCYTGYEEEVEAWFPAWVNEDPSLMDLAGRLRSELMIWRFGTDGSYTAGEAGIPTVGYGPGDPEMAHRPNEMVSVREVEKAVEGYVEIVRWFSSRF